MGKSIDKNSLIKIVILGDISSGKTSITQRFIFDTYNSPYLNSASKVRSMQLEGKSAVFSVVISTQWDDVPIFVRHVEPSYLLSRTDGAIIVFDTTSESSLLKASATLESLKEYSSTHPAVILVGNKCDEMSEKASIILEQGHMISQKYNISYAVISAKNGYNVEEVFKFLGRIIMLNRKEDCNASRKPKNFIYEILLCTMALFGGTYLIFLLK